MLGFITSVRHPLNSNDFDRVEELLRTTLETWANQTDDRWIGIVVGNAEPSFELPEKVRFVKVDFDPPSLHAGPRTGLAAVWRDKGTKLAIALLAAREAGATHVMPVDADDYVSKRLAGFVAAHPRAIGWSVVDGWRYDPRRRSMRPQPNFHAWSGSCHIVRADLYPAADLPLTATQEQLYDAFGDRLEGWLGDHVRIRDDVPLADLPFPGAVYTVGTGEGHSGVRMGVKGNRPVPRWMEDEFGVASTPRTPWHLLRAVVPAPAYAAEGLKAMPGLLRRAIRRR